MDKVPSFEEFQGLAKKAPVRRLTGFDDLLPPPTDGPAILVYDIETAPALAWVWSAYDTNIIDVEREWYMLCFAYKWLGQEDIGFVSLKQAKKFVPDKPNDMYVARRLAVLFDQADWTVAHNGDAFDRKKANARFLANGLDPPSPYQTVDTLKLARREFAHIKNNLNYLGHLHDIGGKVAHQGFGLWRGCMKGDSDSWDTMEQYNRQDVAVLEELYYKLLPWSGAPGKMATPNVAHFRPKVTGEVHCPKCGSNRMHRRGTHRTKVSEFQTFQCQACRGYSRSRTRKSQLDGGVRAT